MIAIQAPEAAAHDVSLGTTLFFAGILVAMILALAFEEKLHAKKSLIVGLFAAFCLVVGDLLLPLPLGPYQIGDHMVKLPVYIPAIDWGVIAVILGAGLFVDVTARSGLFTWIAIKLTKVSLGDPRRLLWYYGLMTVVFSAVLNNVTAMIIVGSLSAVSLDRLGRTDKLLGFLLIEGLLTNLGGLLTLISSVPNIIVGAAAQISFAMFFVKSSPFVVVSTVATIALGAKLFDINALDTDEERSEAAKMVAGFDENDGIESKAFFWFGAFMLVAFIVAIATVSATPIISDLGMGFIAITFALVMLIRYKHEADEFYKGIDWDLLGFFAALFVVINIMEHAQVLALVGRGLERVIALGATTGTAAVLVAAAVVSAVTDNIPLAAMLAKIIAGIPMPDGGVRLASDPLWWSVIFGANLGGNLTPIGSASTLVAVTIMHKHDVPLSFVQFVKKALPFAAIQIGLALVYVLVFL
ncbi:MAG: SLC13 family permease [Gemmatimonadetes bacterium]|nr:SLC13 family permease [Gemmatimonadota bacterium]